MDILRYKEFDTGNLAVCRLSGTELYDMSDKICRWEHNRALDIQRVVKIAKYKKQMYETKGTYEYEFQPIIGIIVNNQVNIIDGQHRFESWKKLETPFDTVWIFNIIKCDVSEIPMYFETINLGTPVPSTYYNTRVKNEVDTYIPLLIATYPNAVSSSEHPQRPKFNVSKLRDKIGENLKFRDALIDGNVNVTAAKLLEITNVQNKLKKDIYEKGLGDASERLTGMAKTSGFYLGLSFDWITSIIDIAINSGELPG